ncbi:benzoate membrane transport protein [Mycobacterium frederiksbergense]|uniref:Benzoate membrane transport protein n=1 Tax=Mycolicibacterium frederiksbergense TaxID=117567 RepID=A0ABT6KTQ1_9MYCO|nr:benzoate/H(+) symporter BenE family transporter [Mycolicibacterium frederiksbergense]MDH6194107.1 benzoate membrane transport protein [Mycolicibacterium frederiksbergense]
MTSTSTSLSSTAQPIVAGLVTALVGFTSSFAVVIAGLRATGADPPQAASGLFALTVVFALGSILLSLRFRMPITLAWSTPGAAMLAGAGAVPGGWSAAIGAFLMVGIAIVATGYIPVLGDLVARIPTPLAQAMLAGVLMVLCLAPVKSLSVQPWLTLPILVVWLMTLRWLPRWALPLTLVTALLVIGFELALHGGGLHPSDGQSWWPIVEFTMPTFTLQSLIGTAVPLYIVTMATQNVPGVTVLKSFGYDAPWRASMSVTGFGTMLVAPFGGHAINLAALSAALAAGDDAGADRSRRWIAGVSAGVFYLMMALLSGGLTVMAAVAPDGLIEAVAGLALLGTFAAAAFGALTVAETRIPAALTFVTAAAGVTIAGIGGAFWGLVIGLVTHTVLARQSQDK